MGRKLSQRDGCGTAAQSGQRGNPLTSGEGGWRARKLEQASIGTGGSGQSSGMGVTLLCCKSPRKILRTGSMAALENSEGAQQVFYGKPGRLGQHESRGGEGGGKTASPGHGDQAHLGSKAIAVSTCWLCDLTCIRKQLTQLSLSFPI